MRSSGIRVSVLLAFGMLAAACTDHLKPSNCPDTGCGTPNDPDGDGYTTDDCAPLDPAVHPGATEVCDHIDNNCDGQVDNNAVDATTWYTDADGDGYGNAAMATMACSAPPGTVAVAGDCNDSNPQIHPNAPETNCADPTDYNCDGSVGYADADMDGAAACMDCDDHDPKRAPNLLDACDGIDNNCDGIVDNGTMNDGAYVGTQLYPTIQQAIDAAPDGGTVSICRGNYTQELTWTGKGITLTSLTGAAADVVLGAPASVSGATTTSTVSRLTFHNAATTAGAVIARNAPLVVDTCRFENNNGGDGAGISSISTTTKVSLLVKGSVFTGNISNDAGSAILTYDTHGGSQITISDSMFMNNTTTGGTGKGAIDVSNCGSSCGTQSTADSLNIQNCMFDSNHATQTQYGGAVVAEISGSVTIANTTFTNNTAGTYGGAVMLYPLGIVGGNQLPSGIVANISATTFTGNMASHAAALDFPSYNTYSKLTMTGCTISANVADPGQAAVDAQAQAGNLNSDLNFSSTNTTWGGEGTVATNNMPADLVTSCGTVTDVTADVACP